MLYTFTTTAQTVEENAPLNFATTGIQTGCVAVRNANGSASIDRCGYYMVHFNGSAAASEEAGAVAAQIYRNGIPVPGAVASAQSSGATDLGSLSFSALIRIEPNCNCNTSNIPAIIEIRNVGVDATYANIALTITKVA